MDPFIEKVAERTRARQLSIQKQMAERAGEEEGGVARSPLKRLRDPLSDGEQSRKSEAPEPQEVFKRRCYDVSGDENLNPMEQARSPLKPLHRQVEMVVKPDTPAVASIKSRMNTLAAQRQQWDTEGDGDSVENPSSVFSEEAPVGLPRSCVSGRDLCSLSSVGMLEDEPSAVSGLEDQSGDQAALETAVRVISQHFSQKDSGELLNTSGSDRSISSEFSLIGDVEFRSRVERFEARTPATEPIAPTSRPHSQSSIARTIQEKLLNSQGSSVSKANRLRKEREEELRLVRLQSKSDNIWKKNDAEASLMEDAVVTPGLTRIVERNKRTHWLPLRPIDYEESRRRHDETLNSVSSEVPSEVQEDSLLELSPEVDLCTSAGKDLQPRDEDPTVENPEEGEAIQRESRSMKKVTFVLDPEMIGDRSHSEADSQDSERKESDTVSDADLTSQEEELNSSEMIDQIFEGVLDTTEDEVEPDCDDNGMSSREETEEQSGQQVTQEGNVTTENSNNEVDKHGDNNVDEELTFPPGSILSPLTKSVEAVVTPLRLMSGDAPGPIPFHLTPSDLTETPPLYSIDAYRSLRQSTLRSYNSVTPTTNRKATEQTRTAQPHSVKEKIKILNEEISKLQTIIYQTTQALNCCTDEEHGKGSLEEAEAEKLLLVSMEKRLSLLSELSRLKEPGASAGSAERGLETSPQEPCRGTLSISDVRLPLKVEFACSARTRAGRPSHYFFVLIRYGSSNIVATPLATAADAKNGDTIAFPTSITLQDIRPNFEIDVEVYSLSHTTNACNSERRPSKSKVTPKKLLTNITKSNHNQSSAVLPALGSSVRASNFSLVGSHKITLTSLGQNKFPLDKIKFDGKVRKLLGDEFQEKVPFLSPLEGNIYLRLACQSHSNIEHRGFLTMFEDISGFGAWHRRWVCLERGNLSYWNYPNDERSKPAVGCINLTNCTSQCVKPVNRDSCARPNTFELVKLSQQKDAREILSKCWFSADTKEEREEWMEKLNQALLDHRTWKPVVSDQQTRQRDAPQDMSFTSTHSRESIL
nr:PREDICTED: actin-binding protein anillin-like isoform X3 [Lepisosteus oculatus]